MGLETTCPGGQCKGLFAYLLGAHAFCTPWPILLGALGFHKKMGVGGTAWQAHEVLGGLMAQTVWWRVSQDHGLQPPRALPWPFLPA